MSKKNGEPVVPMVGRETLEETPTRVIKFLRAVGTSIPIRGALAARGYAEDDHQEGWTLLHGASGYVPASALVSEIDVGVRDAIRDLDAWDEDGFRVVRATLERRFPDQAKQVLEGLAASTGPTAVLGVKTLLDRLDGLEKSKHKDDHAAIALLAKRGVDKDERERLRALVEKAETPATSAGDDGATAAARAASAARDEQRVAALASLRAWYEEWSEIARAAVKRRDHLILLGLAKRKAPSKKGKGASAPATNGAAAGAH